MANVMDEQFSIENIESLLSSIDGLFVSEQPKPGPSAQEQESQQGTAPVLEITAEKLHSIEFLEAAGFNEPQISEINLGLAADLPVMAYAKPSFTWKQMQEIRLGLQDGLDTTIYENALYSVDQMHELRMGLLNKVDVKLYANLMLSATDMHQIRMELSEEAYRRHPNGYGRKITDENSGLQLRISDDCMNAFIFLPEDVKGRFSVPRVSKILRQNEITYGILQSELERFCKDTPRDMEIKIAHGKKPKRGTDGFYESMASDPSSTAPMIREDGTVDYSRVKVTEAVKAGQTVIIYHPATVGDPGSTVTGIALSEGGGHDLPPLTGQGFRYNDKEHVYTAEYAGNVTFDQDNHTLNIWKSFTIDGDCTRYTGSTEYDGTVLVKGDVRNMAHIKATGDIIIEGMVGSANLYSGGNIVIRGGVNADGKGLIEARGNITGSFFESANLKAGGNISGSYFLGCNVQTDNKLIAGGGKALIQGGTVSAVLGIEAFNIRTYSGSKTSIILGNTTDLLFRRQNVTKQITKVTDEIRKLRDGKYKIIQIFGTELSTRQNIYIKTCQALEQKENEQAELEGQIDRIEAIIQSTMGSYLKVTGTLQAGVLVNICGTKKLFENPVYNVKLTAESIYEETE